MPMLPHLRDTQDSTLPETEQLVSSLVCAVKALAIPKYPIDFGGPVLVRAAQETVRVSASVHQEIQQICRHDITMRVGRDPETRARGRHTCSVAIEKGRGRRGIRRTLIFEFLDNIGTQMLDSPQSPRTVTRRNPALARDRAAIRRNPVYEVFLFAVSTRTHLTSRVQTLAHGREFRRKRGLAFRMRPRSASGGLPGPFSR